MPFQHPSSGVLHFSADYTNNTEGVERFSAYRFFDHEVVGMENGGVLGWTNGCAAWNQPGTNKCGLRPMTPVKQTHVSSQEQVGSCQTSRTRVQSYVWAYVWSMS